LRKYRPNMAMLASAPIVQITILASTSDFTALRFHRLCLIMCVCRLDGGESVVLRKR
jgi:hypothetical protein